MNPKYSIIIPSRNGGKYLEACIETIVNQKYDDYELIISDDHSTDGTKEYLSKYKFHPNIKLIEPSEELSMTEHWEWALSQARGEWQIFVGQDDGLQAYFFELADILTLRAKDLGIRAIMSERAYYFWEGCQPVYGDVSVGYRAKYNYKIFNSGIEAGKALLGIQDYFELPQMYTTSLFHKSLLDDARKFQNGRVLVCHPQDANLGVIAASLENKYLKSYIPLGWVGSSPKSAGMAVIAHSKNFKTDTADTLKQLEQEYTSKIKKSKHKYNMLAGDFSFGDLPLYFWQAFLETNQLRQRRVNNLLYSKLFRYIFFGALQVRLMISENSTSKQEQFRDIIKINKCSIFFVKSLSTLFLGFYIAYKAGNVILRFSKKLFLFKEKNTVIVDFNRSDYPDMSMLEASEKILTKIQLHKTLTQIFLKNTL